MTWWPIGMSLFASNIGAVNFVGIAGSGAASGFSVVMFEWTAVLLLVLLGWIFLPVYIASGIYTMPEYLEKRFGGQRLRIYLSIVALLTYVFATISSDLYSGAIFIQQTIGWNIYYGILLVLAITIVFSTLGGLTTVIFTDAMAVVVMLAGGIVLCIMGLIRVGGYEALQFRYMRAWPNTAYTMTNNTCGRSREDSFHIFRDWITADYPWLGLLLRSLLGSIWYWCANQVLVQRALSAKNITHAKASTLFAGYLKLTPMFIIVIPGMVSRALYPDEVACADPDICRSVCGNPVGCSNIAYPKLVVELLPLGVRGLLLAAMIAAVVSSLTSIFNSSSSLFTLDLWLKMRPKSTEREILFVGRIFLIVLTGVSIAVIPMMQAAQGGQIFKYATTISGYFGAPTCAMFVMAVFWNRANEPGAFWGMLIAQVFGIIRFILDFVYPAPSCGKVDNRTPFVRDFHGYYYTVVQIVIAFIGVVVISLLTKPIPEHKFRGLTYWTRFDKPYYDTQRERLTDMELEVGHVSKTDTPAENKPVEDTLATKGDTTSMPVKDSVVQSLGRRFVVSLCGEGRTQNRKQTSSPVEDHATRLASIRQSKTWDWILNVNAVLLVAIAIFLCGWFS